MRHVLSLSLMCAKDYTSTNYKPAGTKLAFANDAGIPYDATNPDIMLKVPSNSLPAYGYGAFPIGGLNTTCFCGWTRVVVSSVAWCEIPSTICQAVGYKAVNAQCRYRPGTQASKDVLGQILAAWPTGTSNTSASAPAWDCPDMDLSDAWGIVSARDSDAWIRSGNGSAGIPSMKVLEILRAGRAGLRIGNAATLKRRAQTDGVWPTERVHKLVPDDDNRSTGAALNQCSDKILSTFDSVSVAREMVDDLFPVAQGIFESAPMSFCLRYAIEYSRLRMLKAVRNLVWLRDTGETNAGGIEDEVRKQKSVVDLWKGRCESQLNMLAVCKGHGVFDMVPSTEVPYDCPFVITNAYSAGNYYVTPTGCLLYYNKAFYNPCRHSTRPCTSS